MKKINTNKKLRISNNKTKIINEERQPDEFNDLVDASGVKEVGNILKNLGLTQAEILKFGSNVLGIKAIAKQLKDVVWHGKKWNPTQLAQDYQEFLSKGSKDFFKNVEKLTADHEQNFKGMLSDIGMSEGEMNALMFGSLPPLAVMNKIYDYTKKNASTGRGDNDSNLDDLKRLDDLIPAILYLYTTGNRPEQDDGSSALVEKMKNSFKQYCKVALGTEAYKKVLSKIHDAIYYKTHYENIKSRLKEVDKNIDFNKKVVACLDEAVNKISTNDIDECADKLKSYFTQNADMKPINDSFNYSLNLNTMLIKEEDEEKSMSYDAKNVNNLARTLSLMYILKNKNKIKENIIDTQMGSGSARKFAEALENRDTFIKYAMQCYVTYITKECLLKIGEKFRTEESYDLQKDGEITLRNFLNTEKSKIGRSYHDFFDTAIKEFIEAFSTTMKKFSEKDKQIGVMINLLDQNMASNSVAIEINTFNWKKYGSTRIMKFMNDKGLLGEEDFEFLQLVQKEKNDINGLIDKCKEESRKLANLKSSDSDDSTDSDSST